MSDDRFKVYVAVIEHLRASIARDQEAVQVLEDLIAQRASAPPTAPSAAPPVVAGYIATRAPKVDPEQVRALHAQGMLEGQIGAQLGVSAGAILQWRRKLKLEAHTRRGPRPQSTELVERVTSSVPIVRWLKDRGTIIAACAEPGLWKVNDRDTIDRRGLLTMANRKRQLAGMQPFVWEP